MAVDKQGCSVTQCEVSVADLPLCCPLPNQRLWDAHPRVYLPIQETGGQAVCPYCDTRFILKSE